MARYDKFDSKEAAWQAIASWGREIVRPEPSSPTWPQAHSQDISASDGGVHTWTTKDSLVSEVLDEAIVHPAGRPAQPDHGGQARLSHHSRAGTRRPGRSLRSPISRPRSRRRSTTSVISDKRQEYKAKLRKKIPVWNIFEEADKCASRTSPARRIQKSSSESATR